MARESKQKWIGRNRPPRVQIKYGVYTGGADEQRELPFVVGVLANLSGQPQEPVPPLVNQERQFEEIDRDNFNARMRKIAPRLAFQVANKLTKDDTDLAIELRFRSMEDFRPEHAVNQIKPLRELLEKRQQLSGLLAKMDGNDRLNKRLQEIITNTELRQKLSKEKRPEPAGSEDTKEQTNE